MRTFIRKKKENTSELLLLQVQEKKKYDFFAALAKALLLFLLVYGALGGFLDAFTIEYNEGLCMLVLFLLALMLSAVYETGKRWLTNLLCIILFVVYVYLAFSNYWVINSGYYAIMNTVFQEARDYLDISSGVEYSTVIQDEYSTVTLFVIFLGIVGVILLNIQIQNSCSLFKIMLLTLTPYVVPFYLECSPSLIYILLLFTGYGVACVLQNGGVKGRLSHQMRYVLPLTAVLVILIVRLTVFVMPQVHYINVVQTSEMKETSMEAVGKFAQFGMSALFQRGSSGAGMSAGALSKGSARMPNYETDLVVRYTPYSFGAVYLKAYTGMDYTGDRWTPAGERGSGDGRMEAGVQGRREAYEQDNTRQGRGVMEVKYVGADAEYEYRPYYTDYEQVEKDGKTYTYTYYPMGGSYEVQGEADASYLIVSLLCEEAVEQICSGAGFGGTAEEIATQIIAYFKENYSYTLRPGYYWGNPDYISHFLLENKKGYCAHFASAGTMLFRYMGIPARYVEGYAFSYLNVLEDGELVEDAVYADYYDGYSPMGETALVELEVPDACAHAWVEIYVEGKGWIVVDPTPASEEEEETRSFWDAFMNGNAEGDVPDIGETDFGAYLETALGGASYLLLAAGFVVVVIVLSKNILRYRRERSMTGKERVCLAYSRLEQCLYDKNKKYRKLRTPAQHIEAMREDYGQEIAPEQERAVYEALFAQEISYDCESLCNELKRLRRSLALARKKK